MSQQNFNKTLGEALGVLNKLTSKVFLCFLIMTMLILRKDVNTSLNGNPNQLNLFTKLKIFTFLLIYTSLVLPFFNVTHVSLIFCFSQNFNP